MRRFVFAAIVAVATAPALAADVGVTVTVGQPGYYGRIDIDNFPQPQLIYRQPVVIEPVPVPVGVVVQPIYVHVPQSQAKNWRKHCRKYNACDQPVYFVSDTWYNDVYVKGHGKGHDKAQGKKQKKD